MTPQAAAFADAVEAILDGWVHKLASHEVISALESVLDGAWRDSGEERVDWATEAARARRFIDEIGGDLLHRRVADWFPEAAHNAASQMSEDMRSLGSACLLYDMPKEPRL